MLPFKTSDFLCLAAFVRERFWTTRKIKNAPQFPTGRFDFSLGSTESRPTILSGADAGQFLVVLHVHNLELLGVHPGVGAE